MKVKIAAVNTRTDFSENAYKINVERAEKYVEDAVAGGADLVVFPETFPGEWKKPITQIPVDVLTDLARKYNVHIVGGFAEPLDDEGDRCYNTLSLFSPTEGEMGRYRRIVPRQAPWLYKGGQYWDFDWIPSDELPIFETPFGKIGMLVCSEVYSPELSRILALKGADIIVLPNGLAGPEPLPGGNGGRLYKTWTTLAWARAIENLCVTVLCGNIPIDDGKGTAMICTPEEVLLQEHAEGVHIAEVDMDRVHWLRGEEDRVVPTGHPWATKPGVLRDWRREDVLEKYSDVFKGVPQS